MQSIAQILASELGQPVQYVENVIALLDEGSTIPFIARYRKEQHGSMDDTTLRKLEDRLQYLRNLDKRRQEVKSAIDGQGKLTEALAAAIDSAATLAEVEDLYRPYKQKRRTRATVAREKGLEPLAQLLLAQEQGLPRAGGGRTGVHRSGEGRGDRGRRIAGRQRHHRGDHQRRRGHPQGPAGPADAAGTAEEPCRHGGGQRVPAVLRL